ncbi:substrate-binding periplasmic protein [Paenirhodobacter populi]|nr:transporter substrate-binding domain-containing protein [Sinirhodobacter populi]
MGLAGPIFARTLPETWRLLAMEDFAPYNFRQDGRFQGLDIDILNAAAVAMNVRFDYLPLPWHRALLAFDNGQADALFQLTPTEQRSRTWRMVGPLRDTVIVFVTRADSPLRDIRSLNDLRGRAVGVVRGFTYSEAFDRADFFLRESSVDEETNLRKVLLGRCDLAVAGRANVRHVAQRLGLGGMIRILPTPLFREGRYIAFHRTPSGDDRGNRLQRQLDRMHADGQITAISARYDEGIDAR